jgi:predicted metal-dependent peptidase
MLANKPASQRLTPERKLQRTKINLLRNPKVAVMSGILMVGKTYVDPSLPTARTNGRDEWYGAKFVDQLNERELAFVIMHEASHKMYRHLTTWKKLHDENHQLANAACDYVVNLMLRDLDPTESFMAMPRDKDGKVLGLIDERFRGMNAKQVFDILKQEQQERGKGQGQGEGEGFDEHQWGDQLTEEEAKDLEREIDQAIRQGLIAEKKAKGSQRSELARTLEELATPKVDWREQLREFVRSVCAGKDTSSWRKPNRRFIGSDIYLPTMVSERVRRMIVANDTSGSITTELNAAMSEFVAICEQVKPEYIDLLYWGSHVAGHETYEGADASNIISSTRPIGGGGTSPSCITAYIKEKQLDADCVVVFTDGEVGSDWGGDWPCPVLWCVIGGKQVATTGKTIHIQE